MTNFSPWLASSLRWCTPKTGCIRYEYTLDTASPLSIQGAIDDHRVTLIEQWESAAELADHLQAPHMKQYGPAMGALRTGDVAARVTRPIDGG